VHTASKMQQILLPNALCHYSFILLRVHLISMKEKSDEQPQQQQQQITTFQPTFPISSHYNFHPPFSKHKNNFSIIFLMNRNAFMQITITSSKKPYFEKLLT